MTARPPQSQPADVQGEPETMTIYEERTEPANSPTLPGGEITIEVERPPVRHGGGGRPASIPRRPKRPPPSRDTTPLEPAPPTEEELVRDGKVGAEEALAWFQAHGMPDLKTLPTFVNGAWSFPEGAPGSRPHTIGAGPIGFRIVPAAPSPSEASSPPPGAAQPRPSPAPAPGSTPPPPPVPGSVEADRQRGFAIGRVHGEFRAWSESFSDLLMDTHGGVSVWDNMSISERKAAADQAQSKFNSLPKLPNGIDSDHDEALREGFKSGAKTSYSAAIWENRAVWVFAELAKGWAVGHAATPTPVGIGAVDSARWSDCAAQTATAALEEAGYQGVDAAFLRRNFGLPRSSISGFKDAMSYAKNWFTGLGLELSPRTGGFGPITSGGVAGQYVLFFEGGATGGHVVYGTVTQQGIVIIDRQLGASWKSVQEAQSALGMAFRASHRIVDISPAF